MESNMESNISDGDEYPTVEYNKDRSQLCLKVSEPEATRLRQIRDEEPDWGTSDLECDYLEPLLCNSELMWLDPSDTGDLTSAPLLGITGGDESTSTECKGPCGAISVGYWDGARQYVPVLERWGYPHYALRSFLDDLADTGVAVFLNHW